MNKNSSILAEPTPQTCTDNEFKRRYKIDQFRAYAMKWY